MSNGRRQLESPSQKLRPLIQAEQAKAARMAFFVLSDEPDAVISDAQFRVFHANLQFHFNVAGFGVTDRVGQSFLCHSVETERDLRREVVRVGGNAQIY